MKNKIPPCPTCGEHFENVFEATDHLLEENEAEFDPKLILPNGYSLMIGSLLRCFYSYASQPSKVRSIAESTYATLYAAETNPSEMRSIVEDMIVNDHMEDIDKELQELIDNEKPTDEGKG